MSFVWEDEDGNYVCEAGSGMAVEALKTTLTDGMIRKDELLRKFREYEFPEEDIDAVEKVKTEFLVLTDGEGEA